MMWRRRKSIVDPRQQVWFALELVAITMGFVVLCGFFLFIPPMSLLLGSGETAEALLPDFLRYVFLKWPMVIGAFCVLLVIGLLMAHRLSGPLYGLGRVLEAWRNGDRTARVRFRKYDYLLPAKQPINDFLDAQELLLQKAESLAREIEQDAERAPGSAKTKAGELLSLLAKTESPR